MSDLERDHLDLSHEVACISGSAAPVVCVDILRENTGIWM